MARVKYPRTLHFPWSPGRSDDDKVHTAAAVERMFDGQEVVVSEKLDGECTTIYSDSYTHARSLDSKGHESRDAVRALAATVGMHIPEGWRVCGENLYARHAIEYNQLPSYFMVFGIYDQDNRCLSWDDTVAYAEMLGLSTVPVLYRGIWDEAAIKSAWTGESQLGSESEGYVARLAGSFEYADFGKSVAKYVRKGHVQPDSVHWFQKTVVPNTLKG